MLGFPLVCFEGMKLMMFQLSSFYCKGSIGQALSFAFRVERSLVGPKTSAHAKNKKSQE